jgi:hypothetical protein
LVLGGNMPDPSNNAPFEYNELLSTCEKIDMYTPSWVPTSISHLSFVVCTVASFFFVSWL